MMSGKPKGETYKKAKNKILQKGCSVTELKGELRKQFKTRIKDIRQSLIDSNRKLPNEDVIKRGYEELHSIILSEIKDHELLEPNTVLKALNELEKEMLEEESQKLVEDYEKELKNETDAIIENLFSCKACDIVLNPNENEICVKCADTYFDN